MNLIDSTGTKLHCSCLPTLLTGVHTTHCTHIVFPANVCVRLQQQLHYVFVAFPGRDVQSSVAIAVDCINKFHTVATIEQRFHQVHHP